MNIFIQETYTTECSQCGGDGTDWDSDVTRPCRNCHGTKVEPAYTYQEATFDDIKQAHPKCGTCRSEIGKQCNNPDSPYNVLADTGYGIRRPQCIDLYSDYCRYHKPKEEK